MNINGIAHIALNVSDLKKSKLFYDKILTNMGLSLIHSSNKSFYYVGGKTGILIQQANADKIKKLKFSQDNLGLHHFCFRMKSKEDIEQFYFLLKKIKANINLIRSSFWPFWPILAVFGHFCRFLRC